MKLNSMSALWARTALLWFAVTVSLGMYMGVTEEFQFTPSHAHMGVLGWLSSGVYAFFYAAAPEDRAGARAPSLHWAAHTIGVAIMAGALFVAIGLQNEAARPVIGIGASIVVASVFWSLLLLWPRLAPRGET